MAQASGYHPPKWFNFNKPEEFPSWIRKFENYRIASKLDLEDEKRQVFSRLYAIMEKADAIIDSFRLSDDDWNIYTMAKSRFEAYLVKKRNIIFDQVWFFQRRQEEGDPVAHFVDDVYALPKYCNFGAPHDELIRDILVTGIHDKRLLERLQSKKSEETRCALCWKFMHNAKLVLS